jgi:hypothetical protein
MDLKPGLSYVKKYAKFPLRKLSILKREQGKNRR